jgi:hypothetical protein
MMPTPGLAFFTIMASLAYLGLAILGGGGLRPSSVHLREPQACSRALKIVLLVLSAVALFPSSIPRWGA